MVSTIKSKEDRLKPGVQSEVKQYLIHQQSLQILSWDDYREHFDYGLKESYSPDGKLRLISQRIHDSEKNNDFFIEKLYDSKIGTLISSGECLAFSENRRESLLDRHDASLKLKQESEFRKSERLTLAELESQQIAALK